MPYVACPGRCGRGVPQEFDTDGRGHLVDSTPACRPCRATHESAIIVIPPGFVGTWCADCEHGFVQPRRHGRLFARCERCRLGLRPARPRPRVVSQHQPVPRMQPCARCGTSFTQLLKQGRPYTLCEVCRS